MKRGAYWTIGLLTALLVGLIGAGTAQAELTVRTFAIPLTGAEEVPVNAHGNADRGSAAVTVDSLSGTVCAKFGRLTLTSGEPLPHIGHIHRAPFGMSGPIVIHFFGGGQGTGPAPTKYPTRAICHRHPESLEVLADIIANPENYYVNLHNTTHPSGVVRGQLKPLKESIFDRVRNAVTPN